MVGHTYDANDRLETETKDKAGTADDRHTIYTFAGTTQTNKTIHAGLDNAGTVRETTSMAYNEMGRLASTAVTTFDTGGTQTQQIVTDYTYNDQGLRVTETTTTDGGTPIVKTFLFDPSNPTGYAQVLEAYVDDVLAKTFTLGHDVITEAHHSGAPGTDPGTAYTFLHDGHGSTRALLEASMAYAQQYAYTAYGVMIDGAALTLADSALTNLLYSGEHTNANGTHS